MVVILTKAIYSLKESLNVKSAVEINSKRYKRANFLLLNRVFNQIVTCGLFDKNKHVWKTF